MSERMAVVTGAGQGTGRAICLRLARDGWRVVLVGRTREKLEAVSGEMAAAGGAGEVQALDVTDSGAVSGLAEWLKERFTAADALVNCAGEALIKPTEATTDADWGRILAVNLTAPFLMARALLPLLRQSDNASIVNIGSMAAVIGAGEVAAYSAAKTGLVGFTRSLAAELKGDAIRVAMVNPSPADTPMRWATTPDIDPAVLLQPSVIADMVAFLLTLPRGVTMRETLLQTLPMMGML